ncbi:MAG: chromophore lyase CpcT/CpeT [Cyanobacteria bacterium P01_D01_bin.44]
MTLSTPASQPQTSDLITLASWMAGDFSNQKQAFEFPTQFAHIRIFFRPLPYEFFSGVGLYSEQTYDYDLWQPYRQGVHRLVDKGDHVYIENYGLKDGVPYAGGGHNLDILRTLTHDCIQPRHGCSMVFRRDSDEMFIGSVEPGNACLIPRQGCLTYLTSHVEVTPRTWVSLDQGRDVNTHEHVWGSTEGMLKFEKWESFAHELPR